MSGERRKKKEESAVIEVSLKPNKLGLEQGLRAEPVVKFESSGWERDQLQSPEALYVFESSGWERE